MPQKPNKALRILVPLLLIVGVIGALASIYVNQTNIAKRAASRNQPQQPGAGEAEQARDEAPPSEPTEAPDEPDDVAEAEPEPEPAEPTISPADVPLLRARTFDADAMGRTVFGAENEDSPELVRIEVSPFGAGLESLVLSRHFETIAKQVPQTLQEAQVFTRPLADGTEEPYSMTVPFAALGVHVDGQDVNVSGRHWRAVEGRPGAFEAIIEDEEGTPVLRIERAWRIVDGSYDLHLRQRVENLADRALTVAWSQNGPIDMAKDSVTYGGDKRRVPFGYLEKPSLDPTRQTVLGSAYATQGRQKILGKRVADAYGQKAYLPIREIWPNERSVKQNLSLVWVAMKSRYFAVAVHPLVDPDAPQPNKVLEQVRTIDRLITNPAEQDPMDIVMALRLNSGERSIPAGGSLDLDMGVYAGPVSTKIIDKEPIARATGLDELVYFSFGGMCAFCTFQWLAWILIDLLRFLHDFVVFDWALAIIMLVVIVRTCLHPITRWSQIRMQRFGKQMQALGPKQQKINEKYKDDPKRKQEEMAKLMREEGINPAGMLGCLPMFLQSPIWIALYATLYFAIDLQHVPAFFGVIQKIVPLNWAFMGRFLGDLSEPDRFVYFNGASFDIPLISGLMGPINSLNILPIFLGVVFYLHQKYLTPQTSAALSPEQEQQQKIMKVMMVVMFPFIMYNAPSGLAIYFIANSLLGIVESRHIRKSAEAKGLLEVKKREPGQPGFMQRLMAIAEQQQQLKQQRTGRPGQRHPGQPKGPPPRRPKKR